MARNGSQSSSSKSSSSAKSSSSSKSSSSPSSKASVADAARADQKTSTTLNNGGGKKTESAVEESVAPARVTEALEKEKNEKLVEDKREKKQDEKSAGDIDAIDDRDFYRNKLTALYKKVNPDRLDDIDTLLDKYRGKENELYQGVCDKYKNVLEGKDGAKKKKKDANAPTAPLTLRPRERERERKDPSPSAVRQDSKAKINLQEGPSSGRMAGSAGQQHQHAADRRNNTGDMGHHPGPNNNIGASPSHHALSAHAHAHDQHGRGGPQQNQHTMHANSANSMFPTHNMPHQHGFPQPGGHNNPHQQFPVRPFFMPRQMSMHQQQPMMMMGHQNMRFQPHPMNPSNPEAVYRAHGSGLHPSPPPPRPAYDPRANHNHNHNAGNVYEVFNTPEEYGEFRREEKNLRGRSRVNLSATRRKRPKAKLLPKPELREVVMSERIARSAESDGRLLRRRRNVDCDLRTKPTKIPDDDDDDEDEEDVEEKYGRDKARIVRRAEKERVRTFGKPPKGRSRRIIDEYVQDLDEEMEEFVDLDADEDEDEDEQEVIELLEEMKAQRAAAARKKGQKKKQPCILKKVVKKPVVLKPSLKHTKGVILKKQSLRSSKMHLGVGKSTKVVKKMTTIDKSSRDALKKKKGTRISSATAGGSAGGELKEIKTLRSSSTQLEKKLKKKSNSSNETLGAAPAKLKLKPKVKRKTAFPLKSDQNDEEDAEDYDEDDLKRDDDHGSFRKAPHCEGSSALFQDSIGDTPVSHSRHRPRTTSEAIVRSKKAKKTLKNELEQEPERKKAKKTIKPRAASNASEGSDKSLALGKKRDKSLEKHSHTKGRHPSPKKQEKKRRSSPSPPPRRSKSSKTERGEKEMGHSSKMTKPKLVLRKNKKPRKEKSIQLRSRSRNQSSRAGSAVDDDDLQRDAKGRNEKRGRMKSPSARSGSRSRSGSLPESSLFQGLNRLRSRSLGRKDKKGKRKKKAAARSVLSSSSPLNRKKLKDHERRLLHSKSHVSNGSRLSSSSSLPPSSSPASSLAKDEREKGRAVILKKSRSRRSSRLSHGAHNIKEHKRGRDATRKKNSSIVPSSSSSSSSSSSKTTSGPSTLRDDDSHVSTSSAAPQRRGRNSRPPLASHKRRSVASSKSGASGGGHHHHHRKESHHSGVSGSRSRPKRSLSSFRRAGPCASPDRRSNKSASPPRARPHRRDVSRNSLRRGGDKVVLRTREKSGERRRKRTSSPTHQHHGPSVGAAAADDDGSLSPSQATRNKRGGHHHEPRARSRSHTPADQKPQSLSPRRRFNRHESPPRNHHPRARTRRRSPPPSNIAPLAFRNKDRAGRNVSSTSGGRPRSRSDRDKKNARRDHQPRARTPPDASLRRGGERSRSDRRRAPPQRSRGGSRGRSPMGRRSRSFGRLGGRARPRGR